MTGKLSWKIEWPGVCEEAYRRLLSDECQNDESPGMEEGREGEILTEVEGLQRDDLSKYVVRLKCLLSVEHARHPCPQVLSLYRSLQVPTSSFPRRRVVAHNPEELNGGARSTDPSWQSLELLSRSRPQVKSYTPRQLDCPEEH